MTFDLYVPSKKDQIKGRTCPTCGVYFPSIIAKNCHKKVHGATGSIPCEEASENESEEEMESAPATAHVYKNIFELIATLLTTNKF